MQQNETDFEFALGEKVAVGTQTAVVTGMATYAYEADDYQLLLVDDDGLPFKDWFESHLISKLRNI
jgi:hypothetical protein